MTGFKESFVTLSREDHGTVTFGDNKKGNILGKGDIHLNSTLIKDVLFVDSLKHNIFSVSQFCDKGYQVMFDKDLCKISLDNKVILSAQRYNNIYLVYPNDVTNLKCLVVNDTSDSWLWHRRLGHSSMDILSKLVKEDLVKGIPKLTFENDKLCDACQKVNRQNRYLKQRT